MTKEKLARLMFEQFAADRPEAIDAAFCGIPWEEIPDHHQAYYMQVAEIILRASDEPEEVDKIKRLEEDNFALRTQLKSLAITLISIGTATRELIERPSGEPEKQE